MNKVLFPFVCLGALSPALGEQVYRTVDERGVVSYSDVPASGNKSQNITIKTVSPEEKAAAIEKRQQFLEEQRQKKEIEAVERKKRKAECSLLFAQRTQLNLPGPYSIPIPDGDGAVLVVVGRAKLDLLEDIKHQIQQKCQ